ncbi:hypothetical protein [Odoribacter laneus]|uniref:hypothetical protein n=1 Tax=Odoribacter laneus TaxID=626933 RepID=UPI00033D944D|nr:hypothetical protein [Odoribacter laneus]CCZ81929.1 putative uncharacterized protein [Odoribacter laneus CAG:561]
MERIDKIVFGDNQFFGINHMSQEKAQQLAEKFYDIRNIYKVYDIAFNNGINAVMLNSNNRAKEICNYFRDHKSQYAHISWYPSVPYPHKYANLVAEKGIFSAINEVLFSNNSAMGVLGMVAKGGMAVLGKDAIKLMQMLVDAEFRIYKGLNVKALFLQNIITDLLLGYEMKDIFYEYCEFVRKKYKIIPGLITQNLPFLKARLKEWGISEVIICSSINKIGYLMSPDVEAYVECIRNNDVEKYQIMAMSTLASGAVPAKEAYEFINDLPIQSVVFGASQEKNIRETVHLIQLQ